MLSFLPASIRGSLSALLLVLNTLVCFSVLLPFALIKLLPWPALQKLCTVILIRIAEFWILCNSGWMKLAGRTQWDVTGHEQLDHEGWYLVISNHQSWADILMLQYKFNRRMPILKFFLKQELIWVPVIGLCWWALEFPFMKRFSKEYLIKYPEKRGEDLATTRKACQRYQTNPVSVFNFLEGTRFTEDKHTEQASPYRYLLKPRAGGIAFVIDAMGEQLTSLINVTIHYPGGNPSFWDLLCGRIGQVVMRIDSQPIPAEFLHRSYDQDEAYRLSFQEWVNELWSSKDAELEALHRQYPPRHGASG